MTHAELERAIGFVQRHRFSILLGFMTLFLVSLPIAHQRHWQQGHLWQDISDAFFYSLLMISAIYSVERARSLVRLAIVLVVCGILARSAFLLLQQAELFVLYHVLNIGFLALVVYSLLLFLFRSRCVDGNMISASLCCYLLLGLLWANFYSLAAFLQPDAFAMGGVEGTMHFGIQGSIQPVYYSFVTLTTLGYGDIQPTVPLTQMLAIVEALLGQLYLVVIVARLVGLHIAQEK